SVSRCGVRPLLSRQSPVVRLCVMGKRSRKRASAGTAPEAPSEPVPERAPVRQRGRRPTEEERPPAPWGKFPLVELSLLLALILGVAGIVIWGREGQIMLACAAALGSLAVMALSIQELLPGFKWHSTTLAGTSAMASLHD